MRSTRSLINALRVLASEIQSEDGVANACVAEAANRLEEQWERIKHLESVEKSHAEVLKSIDEWMQRFKTKEAKP